MKYIGKFSLQLWSKPRNYQTANSQDHNRPYLACPAAEEIKLPRMAEFDIGHPAVLLLFCLRYYPIVAIAQVSIGFRLSFLTRVANLICPSKCHLVSASGLWWFVSTAIGIESSTCQPALRWIGGSREHVHSVDCNGFESFLISFGVDYVLLHGVECMLLDQLQVCHGDYWRWRCWQRGCECFWQSALKLQAWLTSDASVAAGIWLLQYVSISASLIRLLRTASLLFGNLRKDLNLETRNIQFKSIIPTSIFLQNIPISRSSIHNNLFGTQNRSLILSTISLV